MLLGERPSALALLGIFMIAAGVFALTWEPGGSSGSGWSIIYGLLTGAFIAAYTLWDKQAVSMVLIPPLLLSWATTVVTTLLLTPMALSRRGRSPS